VVGTTHDVEGSLVPDFENPANTSVGTIRIDLSTLTTDSGLRNRAIHDAILQTSNETFRYAEFTPTKISGLPDTIQIGQPFTFQLTGNLTIHGVTKEETFDVTVTPVSNTRLEGIATLTIHYADFEVAILRLPMQVASVEDQVILELQFVAAPG
jgi:polyisoprenoid-binding protein YceI